jgi:hypothetical protein
LASRETLHPSELSPPQDHEVAAGADNSVFGSPSHRQGRRVQLEGPL